MNGRVARSRSLQLTFDQLDVVDVKLTHYRLTMALQRREEIASVEDALQSGQGQVGRKRAIFGWKANLHQMCVKGLLHLAQNPSHFLNTHPQNPWTRLMWKNPDPGKR